MFPNKTEIPKAVVDGVLYDADESCRLGRWRWSYVGCGSLVYTQHTHPSAPLPPLFSFSFASSSYSCPSYRVWRLARAEPASSQRGRCVSHTVAAVLGGAFKHNQRATSRLANILMGLIDPGSGKA